VIGIDDFVTFHSAVGLLIGEDFILNYVVQLK